ncbi:GTPase IMAP family member 7-like [Micropterus salmoides]|uniref:GTPase IMAP family member 7-like n=1 Tax=Micropterus salmoides TaxID=27706 RepID=UPI0018EB7839|nr:GTPase IMAP family member 7-like [Micropterus salmoides]
MDVPNSRKIIILGKTGAGKSSLANSIFGETKFQINNFTDCKMHCSQAETKSVNGRSITLIDTPGLFDTGGFQDDMKPEIVRCFTECAPGPHVFLIVLKVGKFTELEEAVITKICKCFSEDALKYSVIVFTHGDQLPEGMKIEEYVDQSDGLSDLVKKCGGRCHVVDNKYWKKQQQDEYRSNRFQVEELLNSIDKIMMEHNGGYYTNKKLQEVERDIQKEEERIRQSSGNMSQEEIRQQAKSNVFKKKVDKSSRTWNKCLVCFTVMAGLVVVSAVLNNSKSVKAVKEALFKESAPALATVVKEQIAETAVNLSPPPCEIAEVVEEAIAPVKTIQKTFEVVWNKLHALYESLYNP